MEPFAQESHTNRNVKRRGRGLALLRLTVFAVVMIGAWVWVYRQSGGDPRGWLEALRSTSPWVFLAIASTMTVIGFPISACYVFAGAAFGFLSGWLYCLVAIAISTCIGYLAAKTFLRHPLESLLQSWEKRVPQLNRKHHVRIVLALRILPGTTFSMQSALLALLDIPFAKAVAYSVVGQGLIAMLVCAIAAAGQQPYWLTVTLVAIAATAIILVSHFGIRRNRWGGAQTAQEADTGGSQPLTQPEAAIQDATQTAHNKAAGTDKTTTPADTDRTQ